MESAQIIHEQALACARNYKRAESALLDIILKVDDRKIFRDLGYSSLFAYVVHALALSEAQAYQFIGVARKSREVPELKEAIHQGTLNVNTARRIVSVITPENQRAWIDKAISLPQKKLEMEIVKENPKSEIQERIKPIAEARLELRIGISEVLDEKLARVKDLLSQKRRESSSMEEALEAMADCYLEKHDPVRRAERSLSLRRVSRAQRKASGEPRRYIPAQVKHQVILRDQNQCAYEDEKGRCQEKRWLDVHHRLPISEGGASTFQNLITLCFHHHKKAHLDLTRACGSELTL